MPFSSFGILHVRPVAHLAAQQDLLSLDHCDRLPVPFGLIYREVFYNLWRPAVVLTEPGESVIKLAKPFIFF